MALALGDTVEGLKTRMSMPEFMAWVAYRNKRGPLNAMLRTEMALAVIATQINRACGGDAEPQAFMPWAKDEEGTDVNKVFGILAGAQRG